MCRRASAARRTSSPNPAPYAHEHLPEGPGRLEFRQVTMLGTDGHLLRDLGLAAPGGALVAVVGRSGAGSPALWTDGSW